MRTAAAAAFAALVLPAGASAHVTVLPARPQLNAQQEFVVRVPSERPVATTKVQVVFARNLRVGQFAPMPGWKRRVLLTSDRRVRGVEWSGGSIGAGEYADFRFLGAPRRPGLAFFRAGQTYADGQTKRWSPAIDVTAAPGSPSGTVPTATSERTSSDAAVWLGVIAIVVALGAALAAGWLWSTRPATLPPDEPDEVV